MNLYDNKLKTPEVKTNVAELKLLAIEEKTKMGNNVIEARRRVTQLENLIDKIINAEPKEIGASLEVSEKKCRRNGPEHFGMTKEEILPVLRRHLQLRENNFKALSDQYDAL